MASGHGTGRPSRLAGPFLLALLLTACIGVREVDGETRIERHTFVEDREIIYLTVNRREGVTQDAFVLKPDHPRATVLLFMGGSGRSNMGRHGATSSNFLIRSQELFFEQGLMVAVFGMPTDRKWLDGFRHSEAHAVDIKGVIAELRRIADVPVWAVGTSSGSASVANVAARLPPPDGPDGIVLTSSVERSGKGNAVFDASLGRIAVPVLMVHHRADACEWTPYAGAERLGRALSGSPDTELIAFDGGGAPRGDPCQPWHHHGFVGQEADVVRIIADWIKARS